MREMLVLAEVARARRKVLMLGAAAAMPALLVVLQPIRLPPRLTGLVTTIIAKDAIMQQEMY